MILFFTGTGNSEYVAKRIGNAIGDEVRPTMIRIENIDENSADHVRESNDA